jgi:alpha/beta hydrolase fold
MAFVVFAMLALFQLPGQAQRKERAVKFPTSYRTIQIDGLSIFYREAGPKGAPTLLLLHGLPSSSRMFEPLFVRLSDRYHLVAPDYPGFGNSDWPDPQKFAYTFDHIAEIMNHFTEALGLSHYTLYAGLWRPSGLPHDIGPSGKGAGSHRSGRGRAQQRARRELENAPRVLGGSRH